MTDRLRRRSVSQSFLLELLLGQLGRWASDRGAEPSELRVLDLGGGTGGVAIRLASLGYRVTVIDPSPDALASLERRTDEAGLAGRIEGRQGDAGDLVELIGPDTADVAICHRVLEVVESPLAALRSIRLVLRPGRCAQPGGCPAAVPGAQPGTRRATSRWPVGPGPTRSGWITTG